MRKIATTTEGIYSPKPETTTPSLKDKELVSWVYQEYSKMKSAREHYSRKWTYNLTMYDGMHYLATQGTGTSTRLVSPPKPPYRVRSITNLIRPVVRTEISRMVAQKPSATVVPATGEDEDTFAALAGEQLWEAIYYNHRLKRLFRRNAFWVSTTGNGFIKETWNKNKIDEGAEVIHPKDRNLRAPAIGDMEFTLVTPFHLFVPDLLEEEIENQPYVFQIYTKPLHWARKFYGISDLQPDCVASNEVLDTVYFNKAINQNAKPDSVLVIEAWIKPGSVESLPDGGVLTVVGKQLVRSMSTFDGLPYPHGMYPYAHTTHTPTGKFYAVSPLEDLNSLQKEYNNTRNQIIESKRRMARPQLLAVKGSVDVSKITSEPGQVIVYNQGFAPPSPLPLQPIPEYVLRELDIIKRDMEDISGQHQVTRGSAPGGGVTAATAIGFLQEKDDSLMATVFDSIEDTNEKLAKMALSYAANYYDLPRLIKVVGADGAHNVLELKGSDIMNGTDIRIEGGSALPTSKAAKQALLMDLASQGFISPEDLLSLLDMGGVSRITERLQIDANQARRENLKFKNLTEEDLMAYQVQVQEQMMNPEPDPETGLPVEPDPIIPVNEWDNHEVHIQVHDDYCKGTEFEMLPDEIKAMVRQHVNLHKVALSQMQMGALQSVGAGQLPAEAENQGGENVEPSMGPQE